MSINIVKGKYPHVGWVDIENKGVLTEVAIVSNKPTGLSYINLNSLDAIDKSRLFKLITNRNAQVYELWDLMSNYTLGNGANALEYFHQYVKVLTPSGQVMTPQIGRVAIPRPRLAPTAPPPAQAQQQPTAQAAPAEEWPTEAAPVAEKTTTSRQRTIKKSTVTA